MVTSSFQIIFLLAIILANTSLASAAKDARSILKEASLVGDFSPYAKKQFVIVKSTKNYADALTSAKAAAERIPLKLDLRDLVPISKTGLTFSKNACTEDGGDYPCYVSRGRYDDGSYVSIEYSNAFKGFAKGYYIVIVASGSEKRDVEEVLKKARVIFPDSYVKGAEIYMGCMH